MRRRFHQYAAKPMTRRTLFLGAAVATGLPLLGARDARVSRAALNAQADHQKHYTITGIDFVYGTPPPSNGPGIKMINERFNVDYRPMFVPEDTYTEKLTAVIASGDVPDIIGFEADDLNFYKWAGQGAFLPLDDLVGDYPTFRLVSPDPWNGGKVGGKIYGIPQYYPPYSLTPSIRQDWLDNLGLKMPTTYDELKQVALAFTQQNPTGQGGSNTYGIAMGKDINPHYAMGAYWDPAAWYHKDDQGRLVPGWITTATRDRIQFFADLFQAGTMTRDFGVLNWADTNKEFYSGKAGIFIGAPLGMSQDYMKGLLQIQPNAHPVPIPPFTAPDGSRAFLADKGYIGLTALSAKLADDAGKVRRVLEMTDLRRTFFPPEEKNPQNADFDWLEGHVGQGYEMANGEAVSKDNSTEPQGLAPVEYFVDCDSTPWPPSPGAVDYSKNYKQVPIMAAWAKSLQDMWTDNEGYNNPTNGIISETEQTKGGELAQFLIGEQTKMIAGQRSIESWDDMVNEYLAMGGAQMIEEINMGIQKRD